MQYIFNLFIFKREYRLYIIIVDDNDSNKYDNNVNEADGDCHGNDIMLISLSLSLLAIVYSNLIVIFFIMYIFLT